MPVVEVTMEHWTEAEWENLQRLSNTLQRLLADQDRSNRAWKLKLRITLQSLSMFLPEEAKPKDHLES